MKEDKDNFLVAVEDAKQRLAAGEKPEDVFDWRWDFREGFAPVKLNGKYSYIDRNSKLISDKWFDDCMNFWEGFAAVEINDKWNYINHDGKFLSNIWFDECGFFHEGFVPVRLDDKRYRLRKDGVLCDYDTKEPVKPEE